MLQRSVTALQPVANIRLPLVSQRRVRTMQWPWETLPPRLRYSSNSAFPITFNLLFQRNLALSQQGVASFALGQGSTTAATKTGGIAMGISAISSENYAAAIGNGATASGQYSFAFGQSTASADNAVAMGDTGTKAQVSLNLSHCLHSFPSSISKLLYYYRV